MNILEELLNELRTKGWTVAVHNDYRLHGVSATFWLFTHPCGRWVKGEGSTDIDAVERCLKEVQRFSMDDKPPIPYGVRHDDNVLEMQFETADDRVKFYQWVSRLMDGAARL